MSKTDAVRQAMTEALRNKEKQRKDALSMLLSALKSKAIDKREALTEEEENTVILKEIRQAQETRDTAPASRMDIISDANALIAVYQEFAPQMMNEDEIRLCINETLAQIGITAPSAKEKGLIMKSIMPKLKGKADSSIINRVISELLI